MKSNSNNSSAAKPTRAPAERGPRFALSTISYRERLLESALEAARELGFAAVELWGREPHISEKFDENRVHAARKMIEERGFALPAFASYLTFGPVRTRPEELVDLGDVLHTARCLRTPLVRVWASDVPAEKASQKVWARTVAELQAACDRAAKLSLTLGAEMHDDTLADTAPNALKLLEQVARDNFALVFQVSGRPREETPVERLRLVRDHVAHVHVRNFLDFAREDGERARRAPIGEGLVDFLPLLEDLAGHGYTGYYALEFACCEGEGKRASLASDLAYLKSLFRLMGQPV